MVRRQLMLHRHFVRWLTACGLFKLWQRLYFALSSRICTQNLNPTLLQGKMSKYENGNGEKSQTLPSETASKLCVTAINTSKHISEFIKKYCNHSYIRTHSQKNPILNLNRQKCCFQGGRRSTVCHFYLRLSNAIRSQYHFIIGS